MASHIPHQKVMQARSVFLCIIISVSVQLFAANRAVVPLALVDTCRGLEAGSENMFGAYWSVYDDNPKGPDLSGEYDATTGFKDSLLGGNSLITNFAKLSTEEYAELTMTAGQGCPASPAYGCMVAFEFGDVPPHYGMGATETYGNFIGLGCELISAKKTLNLTGATRIKYWAKASGPIVANFIVGTKQGTFKEYATYYQIEHALTKEWKEYFVYLRGKDTTKLTDSMYLYQPAWAIEESKAPGAFILPWETEQHAILPFDISKVQMVEWELGGAGEDGHVNKAWATLPCTLWVDNITIENYTWYPEDACMACTTKVNGVASLPGKPLEMTDGGTNNVLDEGAWYVFNDAEGRTVTTPKVQYSWIDTVAASYVGTLPDIKFVDASGVTGAAGDTAAYIKYTLGPSFKMVNALDATDTNVVAPFVGIGLSLCNEDDANQVFNADSAKVKGIYFDYKTTGDDEWLIVSATTRQTFLEDGSRFYVKVPATGGVWRGAVVPFENLALPPWDEKDSTLVFDPTKLIALQWSVEGDSANEGEFWVDNVYLLDTANVGIQFFTHPTTKNAQGFSLKQVQQNLVYTLPVGTKSAMVQLYNLQGRAIYSQRVKATGASSYALPVLTNTLSNGVYVFRAQTMGDTRKSFSKAITIMK